MNEVVIGDRPVGPAHPPLVIAEIGINHGGDLAVAKQMVHAAAFAGAEIVKHQTHIVDDEMTDAARSIHPPNDARSIWDVIADSALTLDEEAELKAFTESLGLMYLSTPFSRAAADFLESIGVVAFKIGSGEMTNHALLDHVCGFGRPIIMSTGMHSLDSVERSVEIIRGHGVPFAILECTNLYPSPPEIVSLRGITDLGERFPDAVVGFSDHSIGPDMALASVALGASIVERHFTDSRYREGPDISASMDPAQLRHLVDRSREIWQATRNPKERTAAEESVYRFARSSVVADRDLVAGTVVTADDIWARRPGSGEIAGDEFFDVIGMRLTRDVVRNEMLKRSDLER
jgi:sialic acid synthase SpsE